MLTIEGLISVAYKLAEFIIIVLIGWILGPFVKKKIITLSRRSSNQGVFTFFGSCASVLIRLISIVIALSSLGVDISIIVGSFSAIGLGISLALKDNMANVACGIQILFTKPFEVGDYIQVEDKEGTVTNIEIMFVTLTTLSNQIVILPNSQVINKFVTNYSKNKIRRIHITVPVSLQAEIKDILPAFESVLIENDQVLKDQDINVVVENIKEKYIEIGIFCWVELEQYWNTLYELNKTIQNKKLEMKIPVPEIKVSH